MLRHTAQPNYCLYRMDIDLQLSGGRFVTEAQESKGLNAKTGPVIISSAHAGHSKLLRGLSQFHPAQAYFTGARRTSPGRSAGPNPAPGKRLAPRGDTRLPRNKSTVRNNLTFAKRPLLASHENRSVNHANGIALNSLSSVQ